MVVNCEVKFDNNPNAIYFAGQTLSGVVELTIDRPKKVRGLILKIEGYAKVEWSESETVTVDNSNNNSSTESRTTIYSGREDYISSTSYLIGSPQGNEIELSPGQYRYNFQTLLPAQLPTSCETDYGHIRYMVTVILDRPFKFDLTYKVAFTVIKQLDLNYENPALSMPLKMEFSKTFYCLCCRTKPVFISVSIPMGGFVPGQTIAVSVDINNASSVAFEDVKVSLKKFIRYTSQVPTSRVKEESKSEAEIRHGLVQKYSKKNFTQNLVVPPVPPTNTSYCRVLNVTYEVHIKCKGPTFSTDPLIRLPITIGTVPLIISRNLVPSIPYVGAPSAPAMTPSPVVYNSYDSTAEAFGSAAAQNDDNAPPPSYYDAVYTETNQNAVQLNDASEHTMGVKPFLPRYPVYGFATTFNEGDSQNSHSNAANASSDMIERY